MSDYHKLISTFLKSHFARLRPKVITYRNYKKFDENIFLNNLQKLDIKLNSLSFFLQTITNKGFIRSNDITLVENKVVTTDEKTLASTFNKHCINIVEITSEKIPQKFQKYHMAKANRKYSVIF